jgi:tetratricopeptide (TPR) repeat protein
MMRARDPSPAMVTTRAPRRTVSRRPPPSSSRTSLVAGLIVAALAVGVYLNALDNPFVYDDFFTVTSNPSIAGTADPRWTLVYMPFRPVVNVSYAIDRALWGFRPFGYHLTSILLHACVSVLLFVSLRRMLADARRSVDQGPEDVAGTWAAFAGAALFAVHPVQSETAGYVSSRSEILCGLFILGALVLARMAKGGESSDGGGAPASPSRRAWAAGGACLCGLLAMLSKEVAASLPVLVVAYDWLLLPGDVARRRRRALVFIPIALLMAGALAYRVRSLAGHDAAVSTAPLLNLLTQSIVIWRYLAMMVVPAGQAIMHETRTITTLTDPVALVAAGGLVALAGAAFRARRASPLYALGAVWWFACIAPSSSVIVLREGMAEHRVYVASAGVAIAVAAAAAHLLGRVPRTSGRMPVRFAVAFVCLLSVCAVLTVRRNAVWGSPVSVWQEARRAAPHMWEARYALGDALREAGDCPAAMIEYEAVLRDEPLQREVTTNLGICLGQVGRLPEAEAAFRRAIAIDPGWARGYTNLGAVALLEGDAERARDYYLRAIVVDPRNVHARMQLARIYEERQQDYDRAARMCEEARAISPSTAGVGECIERNQQRSRAGRGGAP